MLSYVLKGFRDEGQDTGRPKVGIAQLRSKNLDMKSDRIVTKSFRIQAQLLHFPTSRLLWVNTYLPTDPGGAVFNEDELEEVLDEIEEIIDKTAFDDIVWNGDLNYVTEYVIEIERGTNTIPGSLCLIMLCPWVVFRGWLVAPTWWVVPSAPLSHV